MLRDSSGDEKEIGNEDAVYFNAAVAVRPVTNKERIRKEYYISNVIHGHLLNLFIL